MIRKTVLWTGAAIVLLVIAVVVFSLLKSRPLFDEQLDAATLDTIPIAPPDQALTFARFLEGGDLRVLLVTQYQDGRVYGVSTYRYFRLDESDPIALFATLGYDALAQAARSSAPRQAVSAAALLLPFDAVPDNIGIGTNYVEHARESQVAEKPFVFPKLVLPTPANADVPRGDSRLLDYEAELGFVALADLRTDSEPTLGLVLGNDFTDRWSLVRNLAFDTEMGTTGFVEGKSREGYAPIGNLLVIPQDLERFYPQVELNLYVNGRLRQRAKAGGMVWGPEEILKEIFARENWTFHRYDGTVPLLPRAGTIPRGSIIFSGTPAGVLFKPANLWNHWAYLQPGDEVVMRSDGLGVLRNRIVE